MTHQSHNIILNKLNAIIPQMTVLSSFYVIVWLKLRDCLGQFISVFQAAIVGRLRHGQLHLNLQPIHTSSYQSLHFVCLVHRLWNTTFVFTLCLRTFDAFDAFSQLPLIQGYILRNILPHNNTLRP